MGDLVRDGSNCDMRCEMVPLPSRPRRRARNREVDAQAEIRLAVGKMPDVVLWRNALFSGQVADQNGLRYVKAGLVDGSADLVGLMAPTGRFICLEVKRPKGGRKGEEQLLFGALVRKMGGFYAFVRSVEEAVAALDRARKGASE